MRLNPDCLRDVLLIVESSSAFDKIVTMDDFQQSPSFDSYNVDTWLYHIRQASQADLLDGTEFTMDGLFLIKDLTPRGHEFLANIREEHNWSKTKHIAAKGSLPHPRCRSGDPRRSVARLRCSSSGHLASNRNAPVRHVPP